MIEEKQKTKGKEMIEEKQKESLRKTDKEPALSKKEVDAILSSLSQSTLEDLELLDNDLTEAEKNAFLRAREIRKSFPKYKMTQFGMIDQELLSKMTYQSVLGVTFSDSKKYKLVRKFNRRIVRNYILSAILGGLVVGGAIMAPKIKDEIKTALAKQHTELSR
ncbi:MAG: hypothetical protein J6J27_01625 [Alphaproteobacteria bacterium]|nr:hypothetical protein [Alphaproteobacteria bacterium]